MTGKRKVLMTGAAGRVASILRSHWGDRYDLRLADACPVEDAVAGGFVQLDIAELDAFIEACTGVDTVLHLAADPSPSAEFYDSLLKNNIIGCYNGFEAARRAGCGRIVFASSVNAVLGHEQDNTPSEWDVPIFPINVYGATKCWGEALSRVYARQHNLSCICVRLTSPTFDQAGDWQPPNGITPRDTAQVFARCIDASDEVDFAIVNGVSQHTDYWMPVSESDDRVGFRPEDGTSNWRADLS